MYNAMICYLIVLIKLAGMNCSFLAVWNHFTDMDPKSQIIDSIFFCDTIKL